MALLTKLHFYRFEFKYILNGRVRREIESELNFFMEFDPYVSQKPHHQYLVRSLYFDNAWFSHYYDKIDGQLTRSKFRLRTYTNDPREGCATFLELKGRHNNMVFKHRTPLDHGNKCFFEVGEKDIVSGILNRADKGKVLDRFQFDLFRKRIRPILLIDYHRRPYVSKYDPEFRVTFDENLYGTRSDTLYETPGSPRRSLLPEYTIMEVKFRFHVPAWFHRIIQSYELNRVSISKICKGIEVFGLTPKL